MLLCRPSFPVILLDPDAPGCPATFRGERVPRQSSLALPGAFPEGAGQARFPQNLPAAGRSFAALLGPAAGKVLSEGDGFVPSVGLRGRAGRGRGQAVGHSIAPTLPSSHPLGDVQLTARSPASPARRPVSGCITPSSAGVSALSSSSRPPKSPAASPGSGVHPPCWHRATRRGRLPPSLGLQADGRHQLPAASFQDNLSRSLPFQGHLFSRSVNPQCLPVFFQTPASSHAFHGQASSRRPSLPTHAEWPEKRHLFPNSHGRISGHKVPTITGK